MNTGIKPYIISNLVKIARDKAAAEGLSNSGYARATSSTPSDYQNDYNYHVAHTSPTEIAGVTPDYLNSVNAYSRNNNRISAKDRRRNLETQTGMALRNNIPISAKKIYSQYTENDSAKSRSNAAWSQARDIFARAKANYMAGKIDEGQYRAAVLEAADFADKNGIKYDKDNFYRQFMYDARKGQSSYRPDRLTPAPPVPGSGSSPRQQRGPARSSLTSSTVVPQQQPGFSRPPFPGARTPKSMTAPDSGQGQGSASSSMQTPQGGQDSMRLRPNQNLINQQPQPPRARGMQPTTGTSLSELQMVESFDRSLSGKNKPMQQSNRPITMGEQVTQLNQPKQNQTQWGQSHASQTPGAPVNSSQDTRFRPRSMPGTGSYQQQQSSQNNQFY